MNSSAAKSSLPIVSVILAMIVIIAGAMLWSSDVTSDPPMYFSGLGQSLATDPAQYVHHARNQVLYDDWDPFDHQRWTVYQHSLTSLVGYLCFTIAGVSVTSASTVGIILSLGGLLFLLLGLVKHHRPWVVAAVGFCYVINVSLLTYGRLSYLENGLLFLVGLLFFVYSWWGRQGWGLILSGLIVALAAFTGKLFGLLLLPALLAAVWFSETEQRPRFALQALAGFVAGSLILLLGLYGTDFAAAFGYAGEQAYGLRGFPAGLSSPWGFFEHLIAYGFSNRIWYVNPDLFLFLVVSAGLLILAPKLRTDQLIGHRNRLLLVFWIGIVLVAMMPLNYSPLRYALMMFPAIVVLAMVMIDGMLQRHKIMLQAPGRIGLGLLSLLGWFTVYHLLRNIMYFNEPVGSSFLWAMLPIGVGLAYAVSKMLSRRPVGLTRATLIGLAVLLVAVSAISNGFRLRRMHFLEHNFNIVEANEDIGQILSEGAVVSGPYGPVLTLDTNHKSFIHLFSAVAEVDSTLFDRQPITHIAVDISNLTSAQEDYPALKQAKLVTSYWVRDLEVSIYRVAELYGNQDANRYRRSYFEVARDFYMDGQIDSAIVALQRHRESHQLTKSAGVLMVDLMLKKGQMQPALTAMRSLAEQYPTDFYIQMQCGRLYLIAGMSQQNTALTSNARHYFERGVAVNRYKADYAMQLAAQAQQMFRK